MPYIQQDRREDFLELLDAFRQLADDQSFGPGDLNYIFTKFFHIILAAGKKKKNYALLNAFVGVLECCKLELYRRIVSSYEDEKIEENGDVA